MPFFKKGSETSCISSSNTNKPSLLAFSEKLIKVIIIWASSKLGLLKSILTALGAPIIVPKSLAITSEFNPPSPVTIKDAKSTMCPTLPPPEIIPNKLTIIGTIRHIGTKISIFYSLKIICFI